MLLDQKRTRRIVQVVAVLTSIAFVGVIFVVLGLVLVGGGSGASTHGGGAGDLVAEAQDAVDDNPQDAEAWEDLAQAHSADGNPEEAITAAEKSVELAPNEFRRTQTLVALHLQQNDRAAAIQELSEFTEANPENSDAFLLLGTTSDQAGRTELARLAYQRYVQLNPEDPNTANIEQRLEEIASGDVSAIPEVEAGDHGGEN